ncbi:MAG: glycosyltransferase [Bacteroidetes bacterium]|nr:glycosyltransferase [Bacteroidota bacterium]
MKISVIVAFYKNIPFLDVILKGLKQQTYTNFEVIIAEDDDAPETVEYLRAQSALMPYPILHVSQADCGFRKDEILNKAIVASTGELLVFFDGDCIPHRQCLKEYQGQAREGILFAGRRLWVSETLTNKIIETRDLKYLSLFYQARYGSTRLEDGLYLPFYQKRKSNGLMGCNWAILKKHLVEVNGFDEDFVSAGVGEDVDIEWRLVRNGIRLQSMKHRAIVYHLHHKVHYVIEDAAPNYAMMKIKQQQGHAYCVNGLDKHLQKK